MCKIKQNDILMLLFISNSLSELNALMNLNDVGISISFPRLFFFIFYPFHR